MTPDDSEEPEPQNTPLRGEARRMQMNTPGSQSQSSQPLVFATPRTPGVGTPSSAISQRTSTPLGTLPRGDVGRGFRVPSVLNAPPTPETPMSWSQSPSGSMPPSPFPDSESTSSQQMYGGSQDPSDSGTGGLAAGMDRDAAPDAAVNGDAVLWGTTVNVQTCMNVFRNFLEGFTLPSEFEPYYQRQLHIIHRTQQYMLNLNCSHLREYAPTRRFYQQLKLYPQEIIPIMDLVVNTEFVRGYGEVEGQRKIQVRTYGLSDTSRMRDLDPENIDQLLSIKGMVVRCTPVIPDLKQAFFRCFLCNASVEVLIDRGRIDEPTSCQRCGGKGAMEIVHNRCLFTDKQLIRLQETPDEVPEGETPYTVSLFAFDDLVDTVRPGDRIEVTGIYRALPRRVTSHMRTLKAIYRTYIDAIHFRRANQSNDAMHMLDPSEGETPMNDDGEGTDTNDQRHYFSESRIQEFKDFAARGNVYARLVESFAPSIWEMDDVKKGILCQLFGGTSQQSAATPASAANGPEEDGDDFDMNAMNGQSSQGDEGTRTEGGSGGRNHKAPHQRSDINILLCGDPGTSKSQLLSYVHKITPRGIYTSGKGSSAVGLTASVIRDPETRDMVLESGALVLSDNGICCIDEFDKMSDTTRAILHEAMEQQTVSITKAGIIATLNARTSILASANPVESRYNPNMSVVENIKLPPTLLSRFDLIYLVLDKPNADSDRRLAKHLVSLYYPEEARSGGGPDLLSQEFLKDYIYYCRYYVSPEISDAAVNTLIDGYLGMRALGGRGSKTITATPRQLESMIRLSQACAKMRMSGEVTCEDVQEAIRLMKVATQAAATDPRTGTIDMDMITTGRTAVDRDLILKLAEQLQTMFASRAGQRLTVGQIRQIMSRDSDVGIRLEDIVEAVRELEAGGTSPIQYTEGTQTVLIRSSATHLYHT